LRAASLKPAGYYLAMDRAMACTRPSGRKRTYDVHSFIISAVVSLLLLHHGCAASAINGPSIPFVPASAAALAESSSAANAPNNRDASDSKEMNENEALPSNSPPTKIGNVDNAPPPPQKPSEMPFITDAASAMAASNFRQQQLQQHDNADDSNSSGGGWFGKILGKNSNNSDNEKQRMQPQSGNRPPPPRGIPPPPPLPGSNAQKQTSQGPPPPWMYNQQQQQQQQRPPPPPNFPGQQQQPYNPNNNYANQNNYIDPDMYQRLLYDLDESTLREMTLTHELHNLTVQMESLLIRTDVLTERLADNEANFNFVHNRNIELDANCTALATLVSELQSQMETYEAEMARHTEVDKEKDKTMKELREELRKVTDELEQLACLVETERFEDEKSKYLENLKKKQQQKRKKRGFWSWLFGFGPDDTTRENEYDSMEESERTRAARELARSTLLHALQSERASVDELEAAVATLQRNNSAIMDVVESRNSLISELNERVAVFEDDKMVLKAALRQLQKEIKEEAPKTQLLVEELEEARRELELKDLEAEEWEQRLMEMEAAENETKEELELIGTYVDQLEDRLATFAVARKEIELREKKCEQLEDEAKKVAQEISEYKSKLEELTKEKEESKVLLEDLVAERAKGRRTVDKLRAEVKQLNDQINDWKARLTAAEKMCDDIKSESARQLFLKIEEEKSRAKDEIGAVVTTKEQEMHQLLSQEKAAWQARITEEWAQREARASEEFERKLQTEKAMQEAALKQVLDENLRKQREEMKASFQNEMRLKFDEERATWERLKDEEISQRISEEREVWESSIAAANVKVDEAEVERAAAKVYERLEQRGVSFVASEPSDPTIESVAEMLKSKIAQEQEEEEEQEDKEEQNDKEEQKEEQQEEQSPLDVSESNHQVDDTIVHDNEEDSLRDDEASDEITNLVPTQPQEETKVPKPVPPSARRQHQQKRNVPFRGMRKAFARATGLHGVITPSTVQLRQRHARARRKQQQRPEGKSTQEKSKHGKASSQEQGANELLSIRTESTSNSSDENRDPKLCSDSPPVNTELSNDQWGNVQEQNVVYESSNDAAVSSWDRQSSASGGYDDNADEGVHWSQEQNLEPPPLPDF
jgi:hypothetical protein